MTQEGSSICEIVKSKLVECRHSDNEDDFIQNIIEESRGRDTNPITVSKPAVELNLRSG
jgi:hypothetical protein